MVEPAMNWALLKGLVSETVGAIGGGASKTTGVVLSVGLSFGVTSILADRMTKRVRSAKAMTKNSGVRFMSILRALPTPANANDDRERLKEGDCCGSLVTAGASTI